MPRSIEMRSDPLFMRNTFEQVGKYNFSLIKKQDIDLKNINLIACSNTKINDSEENKKCGIHFFVDDFRFSGIYKNPHKTLAKYSQYSFLCSPDFSTYVNMPFWKQIENVAKNRWIGAFWQSQGLKVIPTISWGNNASFDFCFDGVEQNSIVAIGMIGCKKNNHFNFMNGYREMLIRIKPKYIICYGKPFSDMEGNIIEVDYDRTKKN